MSILKYHRVGYSEGTVLTCRLILERFEKEMTEEEIKWIQSIERHYVNWLFSTAGLYDKSIVVDTSRAFMLEEESNPIRQQFYDSKTYRQYIEELKNAFDNSSCIFFMVHNEFHSIQHVELKKQCVVDQLLSKSLTLVNNEYFGIPRGEMIGAWCNPYPWKLIMEKHEKIIILSPFVELIEQQIEKKNYKYLWKMESWNLSKDFEVFYVKMPFCFMNDGPDQNFFETLQHIENKIVNIHQEHQVDIVLLSCGAYSHLLVHRLYEKYNLSVMQIGSPLPCLWGIDFQQKYNISHQQQEYWIHQCPSHLAYHRTDVPDIQGYFGR